MGPKALKWGVKARILPYLLDRPLDSSLSLKNVKNIVIASTVTTTLLLASTIIFFGYQKSRQNRPVPIQDTPPPEKNDQLVLQIPGNPRHLNPLLGTDEANEKIFPFIFDSLISLSPETQQPEPRLAESWKVIDDGLIYEFKLRDNLQFHDRQPLRHTDVKNTFDQLMAEDSRTSDLQHLIQNLSTVTLVEPNTVRFKFKNRHYRNIYAVGLVPILSPHSTPDHPVGSGPYQFKSWDTRTSIDLTLNPTFWGISVEPWKRRFNFKRIRFLIIPDEKTAFETFKNGALDLLEPSSTLHWETFDDREFNKKFHHLNYTKSDGNYTKSDGGGYSAIGWNLNHPIFSSKEIRIALTHALDRREINEREFRGQRRLAFGPFSALNERTDRHLEPIKFNLEASQKILSDLGWSPDPRNGTLAKDQLHFDFNILYIDGNGAAVKILRQYQNILKRFGILMNPTPVDAKTFVTRLEKRDFDAFLASWDTGVKEDPYAFWHSSQTPPHGQNYIGFSDSRVDKILTDAQFTLDSKKQKALYWELQAILRDEAPYSFLYEREYYAFVQTRFENIVPLGPYGLDIQGWYTLPGKEKYKDEIH